MKTLILVYLMFLGGLIFGQTVPLAIRFDSIPVVHFEALDNDGSGGPVGLLTIEIRKYEVFRTSGQQFYIMYQDPRLAYRRKYLGYAFGTHDYEGNTIFFNADTTKCWIWTPDRYGTPTYKMDLPDYMSDWARLKKK